MIRILARRIGTSLLMLFLVLSLTFFVMRLAPGDPTSMFESHRMSQENIERIREMYGLDQPLPVQYMRWLGGMLRGDWGTSFTHQRPALDVIRTALPYTFLLGLICLLCQYAVGLALGILAARRAGGALDHWIRSVSLVLYSVPIFWLGLMAILVFHLHWGILPASGATSADTSGLSPIATVLDLARHLVLPVGVLTLANAARVTRFVRNSLLDALNSEYIRTARAKGLCDRRVIWVHALRNSLVPVVQLFGLSIPALLNGILVIEVVFAWPGLGRVMFLACLARDYPVVLAITAFSATLVILGNLLADGFHYALDPRMRRA